jgi:hypothetical protein
MLLLETIAGEGIKERGEKFLIYGIPALCSFLRKERGFSNSLILN